MLQNGLKIEKQFQNRFKVGKIVIKVGKILEKLEKLFKNWKNS